MIVTTLPEAKTKDCLERKKLQESHPYKIKSCLIRACRTNDKFQTLVCQKLLMSYLSQLLDTS